MQDKLLNKAYVSVIIATYRRADVLFDTVNSIMLNEYENYEVIVVDQTEDHPQKIRNYLHELSNKYANFKYLKISIPNLPLARNIGRRFAKGDIIIYIDDDVLVEPDFIYSHVKRYSDPTIGAVAGRVVEGGQDSTVTPSTDYPYPGRIRYDGLAIGYYNQINYHGDVETGMGCNMSFRRIALEQIGGFDERFSTFREEGDVFVRIRKRGWRAVFEPDAKVIHLVAKSGGTRAEADILNARLNGYMQNSLFYLKNMGWLGWLRFFYYQPRTMYAAIKIHKWSPVRTGLKMIASHLKGVYAYYFDRPDKFSRIATVEYKINVE